MKYFILLLLFSINLFANESLINKINFDTNLEADFLTTEESPVKKEARGDWNRLGKQTISVGILSLGTTAMLYVLPESFTNWDRDDIKDINGKWESNIKKGPVWDHDDAILNYVAHPYVGATYYVAARKSDFNEFDSFLYSFAMSTFFWECGVEAFAEVPSIQDLIVTPVFGSILGEYLYRQEKKILANDGKIRDSKLLGKVALILIDPIGTFTNLIGFKDTNIQGAWTVVNSQQIEDGIVKNKPILGLTFASTF